MGSRRTGNGVENVYAAAQAWVERGLTADDSLFTPGAAVWTSQRLGELRRRFLDRPETPGSGFYGKLEQQLAGSPAEAYQLMGEALLVCFLNVSPDVMSGDTKLARINQVLGWSPSPAPVPAGLAGALMPGIVKPGTVFGARRTRMLTYIIEFAGQWKDEEAKERDRMIKDPWQFRQFAEEIYFRSPITNKSSTKTGRSQRALLHLIFPDIFEAIVLTDHKARIASTFGQYVTEPTDDVDRKLQQIRPRLEEKYGNGISFYEPEIRAQWDSEGSSNYEALAGELYLPVGFLEEINTLLADKKQVIFQGPPGTGKTYIARALAQHRAGLEGRVTLVQFHPSYAYEDFVQGFRPAILDSGQPGFRLTDGPLLRAARQAQDNPDADHFLVIDEINRGNLAKVFGELYFLLEYRDESMQLQYAEEPFALPENLYIIGTMNTADRSIALVDLALRRRFYFVEFHPDKPPIKDLLRRYLADQGGGMEWVAAVVDQANYLLQDDRQAAIGPSYFMQPGLDDAAVRRIWKYSVLPYIEERLFGDPTGRLDDFDLDQLRGVAAPGDGDAADAMADAVTDGDGAAAAEDA